MNERQRVFAQTFVSMYKEARRQGIPKPKVGRRAALAAGYGADSWCDRAKILRADRSYLRNVNNPKVLDYMRDLGLERDGDIWREN